VLVGKTATGSNRWAKRAEDDSIFQITNFAAEWATSDVAKFQASADAGAGAGGDGGSKTASAVPPPRPKLPPQHP